MLATATELTQPSAVILPLDLALAGGGECKKVKRKEKKNKLEKGKESSRNHLLFAGLIKMPSKGNTPTHTHTHLLIPTHTLTEQ